MPTGNPKPQTVASKKYQDKVGWISKSYKLKKEVVELYADACEKAGVSPGRTVDEDDERICRQNQQGALGVNPGAFFESFVGVRTGH